MDEQKLEVHMSSIKILFVDDNLVNLVAAENLMLSLGIPIDKAKDGESAIQMATNEEYDMIFMDLLMPSLDGIMTTKLLRGRFDKDNKTKIIATSGTNMNEDELENLHGLFEDKIEKPLKLGQLKACLERWIVQDRLMQVQMLSKVRWQVGSIEDWNRMMRILESVNDINIEYFLEFDNKDIDYVIRLLKSSRKQLSQAILTMNDTILSGNNKIAHEQLHALKSVLYYIGAHTLASIAKVLDFQLMEEKELWKREHRFTEIMPNYQVLIERMTILCNELEHAIHAYNNSMKNYHANLNMSTSSMEDIMKQIEQILFHVTRYEYIEISNGINYLMNIASQEMKPYINQAISSLEEFEYERVEQLLKDCWNKVSVKI